MRPGVRAGRLLARRKLGGGQSAARADRCRSGRELRHLAQFVSTFGRRYTEGRTELTD